jgi:hypothetical protein
MYEPIYDEVHRMHEISTDPTVANKLSRQKGHRERLLCGDCETQLSAYERYASLVWHGGADVKFQKHGRQTLMTSLDYAKFKLFELSVLWRAGVASGDFFQAVQLGDRHASSLRAMIQTENPGKPHEYGCLTCMVISDDLEGRLVDMILTPERFRIDGHTAYRLLFGSALWCFIVSNHSTSFARKRLFLQTDGSLLVPVIKAEETELFTRLARVLVQQGKVPSK